MVLSEKAENALTKLKHEAAAYNPTFKKFISLYTGLCIDTVVIYILFFSLGLPMVIQYGYHGTTDYHNINGMSLNKVGGVASGVFGSGIFPFSTFLFIVSTVMFIKEIVCFFKYPSVKELERRVDENTISKRMGTMRQMSSLSKEDMMSIGVDAASLNPIE